MNIFRSRIHLIIYISVQMLQSRVVGSSSSLAFAPDMPITYPTLQPPQQGLIQPGIPGMGSSSDILRRTISSQMTPLPGGFKEPSQVFSFSFFLDLVPKGL